MQCNAMPLLERSTYEGDVVIHVRKESLKQRETLS